MSTAGEILKELRQQKGLTLQEVANHIDCSPSFLHRLENDTRKNPSIHTAKKLAAFYEIDLSVLAGTDQTQIATHSLDLGMKKEITVEIDLAVSKLKKAIESLNQDTEHVKHDLVDTQKSLLYIQSLI